MSTPMPSDRESATAAAGSPYLQIRDLTKRFGDFTALKDISLDVYEGEFVVFVGPSGCGKTTLLRAVAGLDIQSAGRIEQAGRDVSALPPAERDFGIVFQSYALFPNLTVRDNVGYGLRSRKTSKAQLTARVDELLHLVGLPDQGGKYPAQLSGGQQQRVALARAIATSPGLLLLDEPLSALDAKVRVHLRHEVKALQHQLGITTIMVTHDQEEALTMADRIVVMNAGIIEQVGTPGDIYSKPASPFVADFIGTMNFLTGTVAGQRSVRVAELELAAESANGLRAGQEVTVCVRPEDVVVGDIGPETPNAFEATIEDMEFLGSFWRARLVPRSADGQPFLADMSANLARRLDAGPGSALRVALPPDRIRVF